MDKIDLLGSKSCRSESALSVQSRGIAKTPYTDTAKLKTSPFPTFLLDKMGKL